jgi:hypothetical protein
VWLARTDHVLEGGKPRTVLRVRTYIDADDFDAELFVRRAPSEPAVVEWR